MAYIPPYSGVYIEYLGANRPGPQWLPQVSLSCVTELDHTASRTLLTQTFINPSTVSPIPSAKYTFPLYESCAIAAFRCHVGRRLIEGLIKEKEDARATYNAAVGRNEPASLLEQHTADVFTTSIGNIPAGETIKVEIEYIMELKHDAEVDGLRFTIPTSIAPRYGALPTGLSAGDISRALTTRSMNISVKISMSSGIRSVQSPSHPISMYLGGHSTDTPDDAFNPQHALATLGQTTTELANDFILLIKCTSLSSPTALLEVHPTIPNSNALMVTLVPKFNLPRSAKPEVVFIVDRSGSMATRVAPLKSSLSVFLKSLPVDVNFNICSFGSHHSFLWDESRPYSDQSFAAAQNYCDRIKADFGGTDILPAIKSTIERRLKDLNLEIMVLTDGQVWNSEELFKYVGNETEKGDVRLFSLGIGRDVSHALIDGLARVGRGFSQVVSDEREGMESKVARMLRSGLSTHVLNYRLEWEGKPSVEAVVENTPVVTRPVHRISLFDPDADSDSPVSFSDSPDFTIPSVIQAPYKIQPLFPFSRSTAYVILSSDAARPPSHVWLRGTTPEGDELELEIAVQSVPVRGETIHQLAARKILQELKDGTSYVHGGVVDRERRPGLIAEWVKKEGVRVGLKYGVAGEWTSFVAVERKEEEEDVEREREREDAVRRDQHGVVDDDDDDDWDNIVDAESDSDDDHDDGMSSTRSRGRPPAGSQVMGGGGGGGGGGLSVPVMMMRAPPLPPISYPTRRHWSLSSKDSGTLQKDKSSYYPTSLASAKGSTLPPAYSDLSLSKSAIGSVRPQQPIITGSSNPGTGQLIGCNPTGKLPELQDSDDGGDKPGKLFLSSAMSSIRERMKPLGLSSSKPLSHDQGAAPSLYSGSSASAFPDNPAPAPPSGLMFYQQQSQAAAPSPRPGRAFSVSPPPPPSAPGAMFGAFDSLGAAPDPFFVKPSRPAPKLFGSSSSKKEMFSSDTIGISYSPSSAPPPERLQSADTGIKPLSSRTKSLIDLQTFEGSFMLDSALATLLGVSISVLEARLMTWSPGGLSVEDRRRVWATVLAIRMFETRLVGERSVWRLVVDKSRAWMGRQIVGVEDVVLLEKMAGEVLGD